MNEDDLAQQLKQFQQLGQADKKIDVATLALAALQNSQSNVLTGKEKRWAYIISLSLPPFGLLYAAKFYTGGKSDGKTSAYMCLGLTVASIALFFILGAVLLGGSGTSINQIDQIKPSDIQQFTQ